jgi:hypothetical protein
VSGPSRRETLGVLAGAAVLLWRGARAEIVPDGRAVADAVRVRPGAPLTLTCPGADAFAVEAEGHEARVVAAVGGRAVVRAPRPDACGPWSTLRCRPLRRGVPCGEPAEVDVLCAPLLFGA